MKSYSVLIFQQIVPDYRVPIFRKLHDELGTLLCHSEHNKASKITSASNKITFPNVVVKNKDFFGTWQTVLPTLRKYKPKVVVAGVAATNFTFLKLLLFKPFFGYKLIAWGHGVHNKELQNPLKGPRGKLMKFYFRMSNAILFYSDGRSLLVSNLIPGLKPKCFVAHNTLDLSNNKMIYQSLHSRGKAGIKKELGKNFSSEYNLIFIGRLLPDKGIGFLMETMDILTKVLDVHLHIVGNGPEEEKIKASPLFKKKIFTYGSIYDENINAKYLYASDLFVMPGYVGLSLIHAFSYGLPIVTCETSEKGPFHSPEIEYLIAHKNGILCKNSSKDIASNIETLLKSPSTLSAMGEFSIKSAYETCTLSRMVNGFAETLNYVMHE